MVRPIKSRCPLDKLRTGRTAEVLELPGGTAADRQLTHRGIRPGAHVRVQRTAPLGGPVMIDVEGSSVAIARALAHRIFVLPLPEVDGG
jgi:ferrous iron transport protein A